MLGGLGTRAGGVCGSRDGCFFSFSGLASRPVSKHSQTKPANTVSGPAFSSQARQTSRPESRGPFSPTVQLSICTEIWSQQEILQHRSCTPSHHTTTTANPRVKSPLDRTIDRDRSGMIIRILRARERRVRPGSLEKPSRPRHLSVFRFAYRRRPVAQKRSVAARRARGAPRRSLDVGFPNLSFQPHHRVFFRSQAPRHHITTPPHHYIMSLILALALLFPASVAGHGYMSEPPSRNFQAWENNGWDKPGPDEYPLRRLSVDWSRRRRGDDADSLRRHVAATPRRRRG